MVDVAEGGEQVLHRSGVDDVEGEGSRVAADRISRRIEPFPIARDQHHVGPGVAGRHRRRQAESGTGTSDDDHRPVQLVVHRSAPPRPDSRVD